MKKQIPNAWKPEGWPAPGYDLVLADPPWPHWGDPHKNAAAGKHYPLMALEEIHALPVRSLLDGPDGAVFLWATGPRLDLAIDTVRAWGLYYRGVAFVWVKTTRSGRIIHAQGIPPVATKPTTEFCLLATCRRRGRPFPLRSSRVPQVILAPRGAHSEKPPVHAHIEALYGPLRRIELFARRPYPGWAAWGKEVNW